MIRGVAEGDNQALASLYDATSRTVYGLLLRILSDRARGTATTLVRMEPGSRIRPHRHLGVEQCLVLEGDVRSGTIGMRAGDFNCSPPGSVHEELVSDGGALLLLVSPEHYEPVGPHAGPAS